MTLPTPPVVAPRWETDTAGVYHYFPDKALPSSWQLLPLDALGAGVPWDGIEEGGSSVTPVCLLVGGSVVVKQADPLAR
jgi:hypothetical protein